MAEGKKSFVLYADQAGLFQKLPDVEAGKLIKIIFDYVNDKNPKPDELLLQVAFEPIKLQLKRDLKEWEAERSKRSIAGKKGGIKSGESRRAGSKRSSASKNEANEADNVNVTVNVNDTVTVNTFNNIKRNFFNDYKWKERFCEEKKIQMPGLEILMNDFITDIELKEDFKTLKELKSHFTSLFNKNKNGTHQQTNTKGTKLGTSAARIERAKNW